jgi:4-amino-4-deoxy-L-arabinose transferase-like glycosyltransferase
MARWRRPFAKHIRLGPYGITAGAIIVWATIFRLILTALTYPEVNSDEGTMGIEAMHIAFAGQHPIYLYGQNYMGVLEAYIAAPLFHLFGVSAFTLRLGLVLLFALFLIAMYWLGRLLYSKKLALASLALLSLAPADMLIQQLRAVGGAIETILCGSLLLVLAYRLAATAGQRVRWRYLTYAAWGFTAGLALWVHILVLPFVVCSGLLILLFCYREWRSPAIPSLLLGLLIGGFPLIPGYQAFTTVLGIRGGGISLGSGQSTNLFQQLLSTGLWGIPLSTGVQPVCAYSDLPTYGPGTALTVPCSLLQGAWSAGYLILLGMGLCMAGAVCWRLWRQHHQRDLSSDEQQQAVLSFARLMHLLTAVLVILLYVSSPLSGLKPWSTRYLVGLLVATPGILWPLWRLADLEKLQLSLKRSTQWLSRVALVLVALVWLAGTLYTMTTIPTALAATRQQQQLVQDLLKLKVTRVYTEYWTCYRLLFQSQEQILCARPPYPTVVGADRYAPDARVVQPDPATLNSSIPFLFPVGEFTEIATFEQYNQEHGRRFQKYTLDDMVLYIPLSG